LIAASTPGTFMDATVIALAPPNDCPTTITRSIFTSFQLRR
jgi:hypothetical protein